MLRQEKKEKKIWIWVSGDLDSRMRKHQLLSCDREGEVSPKPPGAAALSLMPPVPRLTPNTALQVTTN